MITLYHKHDCPHCSGIRDGLEQLAIAFDVVEVAEVDELPESVGEVSSLPVLVEDGEIYAGPTEVVEHLQELEGFVEMWYKFQSDTCYCI
jgi:glutaredoxin